MNKILDATYNDGKLILKDKLDSSNEGKNMKILLLNFDSVESKKKEFLNAVKNHSFKLPEDYKFNREEANER